MALIKTLNGQIVEYWKIAEMNTDFQHFKIEFIFSMWENGESCKRNDPSVQQRLYTFPITIVFNEYEDMKSTLPFSSFFENFRYIIYNEIKKDPFFQDYIDDI